MYILIRIFFKNKMSCNNILYKNRIDNFPHLIFKLFKLSMGLIKNIPNTINVNTIIKSLLKHSYVF